VDGGETGHSDGAISLGEMLVDENKRKLIGTIRKMG